MSYTIEEVNKHCTENDCWIVIGNKVLDVTPFLSQHPAGPAIILKFGGKDVTEDLKIIRHSSKAQKMFNKYTIGILKSNTNSIIKQIIFKFNNYIFNFGTQ